MTRDEVLSACIEYFKGDQLAASVTVEKYLLRDKDGNYLEKTPTDMFKRLANEFARVEKTYPNPIPESQIFEVFNSFTIIPQGSPLYGIGNNHFVTSISNCFVIEAPADSYSGILKTDEELVSILKRRGGCGIDLSTLRPRGSKVSNSAGTSDGIVPFMTRYSNSTKEVAMSGRRGALMETLHCHHPDIESFIDAKRDTTKITGANISVKWTDELLAAVSANKDFTLRWPAESSVEDAVITKKVNARSVWNRFVENNWLSAEPGCLFWDTITRNSLSDVYPKFKSVSTNPCSELPLPANASCILILLNLTKFVVKPFTDAAMFDFELFADKLEMISRLADDMVDLEIEKISTIINKIKADPEPDETKCREIAVWEKIKQVAIEGRRVGIGVTGLADMLAMLGIKYDSEKALIEVEKVFSAFHTKLMAAQAILAKERGAFSCFDWDKEKDCSYIRILNADAQRAIKTNGRRNISISTIAPAGSVSILAQCSSGVEPVFQLEYNRKRKLSQTEIENGIKADSIDSDGIKWINYSVRHPGVERYYAINPDAKSSPYDKATAHDIDWKYKVKLQAVIQKYVTHSISNTCNLPTNISKEDISELYLLAHRLGCKGMTIYREGSRDGVLTLKKDMKKHTKRPEYLVCDIHNVSIEGNSWIFFVGLIDGRPYELFGGRKSQIEIPKKFKKGWLKKNGKINGRRTYDLILGTLDDTDDRMVIKDIANAFSSTAQSYTRLISLGLRHNVPIQYICDQLNKDVGAHMFTFEKGVARLLKTYIKDGCKASGTCAKCGADALQYRDGCKYCAACGDSKCS